MRIQADGSSRNSFLDFSKFSHMRLIFRKIYCCSQWRIVLALGGETPPNPPFPSLVSRGGALGSFRPFPISLLIVVSGPYKLWLYMSASYYPQVL